MNVLTRPQLPAELQQVDLRQWPVPCCPSQKLRCMKALKPLTEGGVIKRYVAVVWREPTLLLQHTRSDLTYLFRRARGTIRTYSKLTVPAWPLPRCTPTYTREEAEAAKLNQGSNGC